MTEKNTNSNGHKQLSPKWVYPDLYEYVSNSIEREGLSQTVIVNRALRADMEEQARIKLKEMHPERFK